MSDPRCERFRELASVFVDERLEGDELLAFEGHLERCGECRLFEAGLRRFRQVLRAAASVEPLRRPPAGFAAGVTARLAR
ncbi:MAG TPA: zf-HC2 domain-containing protein, partial [bacterium]